MANKERDEMHRGATGAAGAKGAQGARGRPRRTWPERSARFSGSSKRSSERSRIFTKNAPDGRLVPEKW